MAARHLETKSGALGPGMATTTVDANFPTLDSSVVSQLGVPGRASSGFKGVSSVATVSIEQEVGIP